MMMTVQVDNVMGTKAIKNGRLRQIVQAVLDQVHPEAAYFGFKDGQRCSYIVFDMTDRSLLPAICEPLFMELGADIELMPVMTGEDLAKGLQSM
jgi:pantothenate synthetase